MKRSTLKAICAFCAFSTTATHAYEVGNPGFTQPPGITNGGATAEIPPPGIYMFEQAVTVQNQLVGPSAPRIGGNLTDAHANVGATGFVFVPGWTFLGATYDAVILQAFADATVGNPINAQQTGIHNTFIVPVELSWKLGQSGFYAKAGLGMYVPDGSIQGPNGLSSVGSPWWTLQPELYLSYLRDGWNFTIGLFDEINTKNTITGYRSGDVLHAEFTATKRIGKWTVGPVAYYLGQVTNDTSSAFYGNAINVNRYNIWAVGGLVGYDFGPVNLTVWAFDDVHADVQGLTPATGSVGRGWSGFLQLSYRLWAPDEPQSATRPMIHK